MKAPPHSGKMQSSRRRYLRRRNGGAPGERGLWSSWDTLEPEEYGGPDYDYEEDRWWSDADVHVYLSWARLLPETYIGDPVLPGPRSLEWAMPVEPTAQSCGEADPSKENYSLDREETPAALASLFRSLDDQSGDFFKKLRAQIPWVLTTPEGKAFRELATLHQLEDPTAELASEIISLLHLRPFWIRPVTTWSHPDVRGTDWIKSLANHLLVQFPVHSFLKRSAWPSGFLAANWNEARKAMLWFILVGRGVSLHRVASHFDWVVTKGLVHWIAQAPEELSLNLAILWAEVMRLGGSPIEFRRLRRGHGFGLDVTDGEVNRKGYLKTLRETVHWLITHRDELTDETSDIILEWYAHEFTEILAGRRGASMKGRSVQGALAVARAYVASRNRPYVDISWQKHGWDWETIEPDSTTWTVRELTTGRELGEEGMAMRHCVSGYACRCAAGHVAIFSFQTNEKRRLTIEISLPAKAIVQVRGSCNRPATPEEMQFVQRWRSEAVTSKSRIPVSSSNQAA